MAYAIPRGLGALSHRDAAVMLAGGVSVCADAARLRGKTEPGTQLWPSFAFARAARRIWR